MTTEQLNSTSKPFRARLSDGSVITYKAMWVGYADFETREDGHASTWENPIDNRRCHWSINGRIVRSVAVVVAGKEYWADELTTAFSELKNNKGSKFVLANLHPENCNDCRDRRDSDFNNMRNTINGALQAIVDQDFPVIIESIKGLPEIVDVSLF
ncbi:hypothetical protein [Agrobacterium vitis]|uniref:hypothetical protein n=1 Tax=Agrobacterium vitis TaxID=373 RepID=UPI0012E7759F|nr:hypothetical protein [Agrobacterium vitis]MUZ63214.1 hypothetical protein [Agrobacterium vitis]